ncbi:MAG: hypothetical protein AB1861_12985, partial [Cyanobacteriota bacterium]
IRSGNGERGTGNGERGTGNGERGTGNRERGTGNGEQGIGKATIIAMLVSAFFMGSLAPNSPQAERL